MYYEACDISEIEDLKHGLSKGSEYSKPLKLIDQFVESGLKCAEVKDFRSYKDVKSCAMSLGNALIRADADNTVSVVRRGEKIFLVRKDI